MELVGVECATAYHSGLSLSLHHKPANMAVTFQQVIWCCYVPLMLQELPRFHYSRGEHAPS